VEETGQEAGYEVVLDEPYPSTHGPDPGGQQDPPRQARCPAADLQRGRRGPHHQHPGRLQGHQPKAIIGSGGGHADPTFISGTTGNAKFMFDIVEWETDVNKPGAKETNDKYKAKYGPT
jgi:branched-chain amino acid transport system substrate-binding protein